MLDMFWVRIPRGMESKRGYTIRENKEGDWTLRFHRKRLGTFATVRGATTAASKHAHQLMRL